MICIHNFTAISSIGLWHAFSAMIDKATANLRAIQIVLGHTKIENTVRYLGVDIEDALLLAERTEI